MKYTVVLALAAVSSAFVVPSEQILADLAQTTPEHEETWYEEAVSVKDNLLSSFKKGLGNAREKVDELQEKTSNAIDDALAHVSDAKDSFESSIHDTAFDVESWLSSEVAQVEDAFEGVTSSWQMDDEEDRPPPPHHGDGRPGHRRPPHHRKPHHPHHGKPNATVYELIAGSKYTTKLAFFINEFPDLIKILNSTDANFTIFAPTDRAFEKIPEHAPKPSKEELLALLGYHVVPGFYPAGRVLATHTVPTLLVSEHLGSGPLPQRLSFHIGFRGLTVNFYSRVVAINIFGSNGVIHGVDSVIVPPPSAIKIIDLLPGEFSTLELGLAKTGLLEKLNTTKHAGGTFFAPSNRAFQKLGPRINAFLFSQHGLKYLKALLEYHIVPNNTLYSDAFYSGDESEAVDVPRGRFHVDLPTLLKDRSLSIDIARFGGFITIRINAFARVAVQDGIAADGVIHVLGDVLLPPRKLAGDEVEFWNGEEMEVDDFKARLDLIVSKTDL